MESIASYDLVKEIGRGALGRVYEARHKLLGSRLAIKVLAPRRVPDGVDVRAMFIEEGRLQLRLRHGSILPVYDIGEADGCLYMTQRLMRCDILKCIKGWGGQTSEQIALSIVARIAGALAYMHRSGYVHRDVKGANILYRDKNVYLSDLGLSCRAGTEPDGRYRGTPTYTAPEGFGDNPPAPAQDVWSLGVLLYAIMSGKQPFRDLSSLSEMRRQIQDATFEPLPALGIDISSEGARLLNGMLQKRVRDRLTADEVCKRAFDIVKGGRASQIKHASDIAECETIATDRMQVAA